MKISAMIREVGRLAAVCVCGVLLWSCTDDEVSQKRYLAQNVVLGSAATAAPDVDKTTKVLAENVIVDNAATTLSAVDVQAALNETSPKLSELIVGTWDIVGYADGPTSPRLTGSITFQPDGTIMASGSTLPFGVIAGETFVRYEVKDDFVLQILKKISGNADYYVNITFSRMTTDTLIVANPIYSVQSVIRRHK